MRKKLYAAIICFAINFSALPVFAQDPPNTNTGGARIGDLNCTPLDNTNPPRGLFCTPGTTGPRSDTGRSADGTTEPENLPLNRFLWLLRILNGAAISSIIIIFQIGANRRLQTRIGEEKNKEEPKIFNDRQLAFLKIAYMYVIGMSVMLLFRDLYIALIFLGITAAVSLKYWWGIQEVWKSLKTSSNAAQVIVDEPTRFTNVGGLDEEIEELKYTVYLYKNPKEAEEWGIKPAKGIFVVGPPGCGKTLLGRAIAGEAGIKFIYHIAAHIGSSYIRSGAQGVKEMFDSAKAQTPCIMFIDEFDALARRRGYDTSGEFDHALTAFLAEIDGIKPLSGVLVIAASNREDVLDEAAIRPGRFDKKIIISHPDVAGRTQILKIHSANKKPTKDVDLTVLAQKTPGFNGAGLEQLCNEAVQIAHQRHIENKQVLEILKDAVVGPKTTMTDYETAIDKILGGLEKRLVMSDKELETIAIHEIGHAVIAAGKGLNILDKVMLVQRNWGSLGATMSRGEETRLPSRMLILSRITILFGGRAAEEIFFGSENITSGAHDDFTKAEELVRLMVCEWGMSNLGPGFFYKPDPRSPSFHISEKTRARMDEEIERIKNECYSDAKNTIEETKEPVGILAKMLREKTSLPGAEIVEFLKERSKKNSI